MDFALKKAPAYRVAAVERRGPWKKDHLRAEFQEVARWAKENKLRTGKWFFVERGEKRFEACVELKGKAKGSGRVRVKTLPSSRVASVTFDPEQLSPRVVYHGLNDWVKWRKKDGEIKSVGYSREVYEADPWTNAKAWAKAEIQYLVR
ncbi:MAG: GyrI-like domain-containing protein [Thermoplasmata archaeon]|nr:GyrI-like domain-containing protein [Thermoplasmata archaeon]